MRDCGGEVAPFGGLRRTGEARWASAGHPVVSFEVQQHRRLQQERIAAVPEGRLPELGHLVEMEAPFLEDVARLIGTAASNDQD